MWCATQLLHPALKDCRVHAAEDDSMKVCCKGGSRPGEVKMPLSTRGAPSLILPLAPTPTYTFQAPRLLPTSRLC